MHKPPPFCFFQQSFFYLFLKMYSLSVIAIAILVVARAVTPAAGYVIHELHHPRHSDLQSNLPVPTTHLVLIQTPTPENIHHYVLDGNRYMGKSCYKITDEYEVTLNVTAPAIESSP